MANESQWQNYAKQMESNQINFTDECVDHLDLTSFQKRMLFCCFQPTKFQIAIHSFICEILGKKFTELPPFDLALAFGDSTSCKPLLFILTSNYDPIKSIRQLAETQSIDRNRIVSLSMGQQQNSIAIKLIENGIKTGDWIVLQNCHLAPDWMNILERICENLAPDTTNPDFRLWLTSNPTNNFPLSIIQGSVKLVNEPPKRLKSTLLQIFTSQLFTNDWLSENKHENELKPLLFSLSFLHSLIIERCNFDAIGWNYPYEFNDTVLLISTHQFYDYLNAFNGIPFETLHTLLAECTYGGHMNDFCDQRCLKLFCKFLFSPKYGDSDELMNTLKINDYFPHNYSSFDTIIMHIKSLDDENDATVCGLHKNANAIKELNETKFLVTNMILAQVCF